MSASETFLAFAYGLAVPGAAAWLVARAARAERAAATIAMLFGLALAARVVYLVGSGGLLSPDRYEYEDMALSALDGRGFSYTLLGTTYRTYGTPLYVLLSAAVYAVVLSPAVLALIGAAIASATAPLAYAFARAPFGRRAAIVAGVLVAVHPPLVVYAAKLHALNLEISLAVGAVLAAAWWWSSRRTGDAVVLGVVTALGAMSRPTFLALLAIVGAAALARWRSRVIAPLVACGLAAALVLLPWHVYVGSLYGRPVFMNVTGGIVFWYGNNPDATGSAVDAQGAGLLSHAPPELLAAITSTEDIAADRALRDAAWSYIAADPPAFVRRTAQKLLYFWTVSPTAGVLYPGAWRSLYLAYYAGMLVLAAVGVAAWWRERRAPERLALAAAFAVAVSLVQSAFYVDGRHRWELESLLLCLSAAGLVSLVDAVRRRSVRRSA